MRIAFGKFYISGVGLSITEVRHLYIDSYSGSQWYYISSVAVGAVFICE